MPAFDLWRGGPSDVKIADEGCGFIMRLEANESTPTHQLQRSG